MAVKTLRRRKRRTVTLDDLGGRSDGGLVIALDEEQRVHTTPPKVAAALRYFLARVQHAGPVGLPSRLALTSALFGEGVTFVTRSLASVLAYDNELNIAIVDLNWAVPREDKEGAPPALVDFVNGTATVDDVIVSTMNPRLSLVQAGPLGMPRRPAMAASAALEEALEDIASRFDHVLLDLPPVQASSDAIRLAQHADAYVLVVRQGVTASSQVESALNELRAYEGLGVILNRVESRVPRSIRRLMHV